jgi:uncharacterized membrane protein YgdD (TMEM256/DUF423 family)
MLDKKIVRLSSLLLALGVILGAFGAHGLKNRIDPLAMATYQTGVQYYFYHAFALLCYALAMKTFKLESKKSTALLFLLGLTLFSGCCVLYALSGVKTFAMIVPLGGVSFVLAWCKMFWDLRALKN